MCRNILITHQPCVFPLISIIFIRYEGELVKKVASNVLLVLEKNNMVVTENLVGIDHHVEKIMGLVNVGSNDVHMVGIHGMAGIGKTTIAEVIYNKLSISGCFECCCFLRNVRAKLQEDDGLLNLQKKLINKIRKPNCCDYITNEGVNTIKDIVYKKKVLIVLDDVDENPQLGKIAGEHSWFGSGSRIIVTTRNQHVLNLLGVDRTYEPPLMEPGPSLQLFCKHAFKRDSPPEDYYILSKNVVSTAAGLPLALERIGLSLFNMKKAVWEDTLKKLKEIPHADVQKSLRISYEGLDNSQESIFLDIACLFIGEDKRLPFCMWDDCNFFPSDGIEVLKCRSLVKIEDDKWLRMHDQLGDFGRHIVRKKKERGKHSRLFIHKEASDVLKRQMVRSVLSRNLPFSYSFMYLFFIFREKLDMDLSRYTSLFIYFIKDKDTSFMNHKSSLFILEFFIGREQIRLKPYVLRLMTDLKFLQMKNFGIYEI